ncbi:hypothetical protein ACOBR2_18660 [Telmatobacter bradus]|uniref:hypothetical protein n=1 Tax=Telmatobacter bradus TaxID=474953 RepID=UPI003B4371D9
MLNRKFFAAMVLLSASLVGLSGCKSAPELSQADAQKLIQAKLDAQSAAGVEITVNDQGMQMGANSKLWTRTKVYPNRYWADFTLTDDGKKQIKLASGKDVIEWRPESLDDKNFSLVITSVVQTHPKARNVQPAQDAGSANKTVGYTEVVGLEGLSPALLEIVHTPGNKLSSRKTASFVLDGGAWKVDSIQYVPGRTGLL